MSLNIDSRGVARGKCTKCECPGYTMFVNEGGLRCAHCDHRPGEHEREDRMEVDVSSHQTCSRNGCTYTVHHDPQLPSHLPRFKYCSPECRTMDMLEQELWGALNNSQGFKSYHYSNPSQCDSSSSSSQKFSDNTVEKQVFPKCAVHGCSNQVFIDTSLPDHTQQMFKYCSRKCRDADLAMHSDIAEEIVEMEKRLFKSVSDTSLSVYIAGNPKGPCRSCKEESMTYSREREIPHTGGFTEELPDCLAKGCRRKVFVDKSIEDPTQQRFQYCSKNCRDVSIDSDIDEEIAQKEKLLFGSVNDNDVSAYIAGNPKGPCRSCFGYNTDIKASKTSSNTSKHEVTKEERTIEISKKYLQDLGIIVQQTPPSAKMKGCTVIGFKKSQYLSLLEDNDISIGFFDVILSVNGISIDEPAKFESVSKGLYSINLRYQRAGIPVKREILSEVTEYYNHIIGIKWTSTSSIKLNCRNRGSQILLEVQESSPMHCNGLRDQDIVKGHVVTSESIDVKNIVFYSGYYQGRDRQLKRAVEKANKEKSILILYICRLSNS